MSRKCCKRKLLPTGAAAVHVFRKTIERHNRADVSEENRTDILIPAFLALDRLRAGNLDVHDFTTLNEFNCMTWVMGSQIALHGVSEATGDVALLAKEATEKAAQSLADIGVRWREIGRFVAKGDELSEIRAAFDLCDQLVGLLPSGVVLESMIEAAKMVRDATEPAALGK